MPITARRCGLDAEPDHAQLGRRAPRTARWSPNFASVTAPNATTLVITTKQPAANMLYVASDHASRSCPQHIWAKDVPHLGSFKNMTFPVVGYGPWIATGYVPNQYATLTANNELLPGRAEVQDADHAVLHQRRRRGRGAAQRPARRDRRPDRDPVRGAEGQQEHHPVPAVSNAWTAIELNPGAQTKSGQHFGNGNPALHDPRVRDAIELAINKHGAGVQGLGRAGRRRLRVTCRPPTRSGSGPRRPRSS